MYKTETVLPPQKHEKHQFNYIVFRTEWSTHFNFKYFVQMLIQFGIVTIQFVFQFFIFWFSFDCCACLFPLYIVCTSYNISRTHIDISNLWSRGEFTFQQKQQQNWKCIVFTIRLFHFMRVPIFLMLFFHFHSIQV